MHGKTLVLRGELRSTEDVTIDGRIEGPVFCEGGSVTVVESASVTGDILASEITVFGQSAGQLTASGVVDIRAGATVSGRVVAKRFILDADARFNGRVEPQHLEAALRVARYQEKTQQKQ
jgi:cytoskeletal protein CcmA (bactofilin family)